MDGNPEEEIIRGDILGGISEVVRSGGRAAVGGGGYGVAEEAETEAEAKAKAEAKSEVEARDEATAEEEA